MPGMTCSISSQRAGSLVSSAALNQGFVVLKRELLNQNRDVGRASSSSGSFL